MEPAVDFEAFFFATWSRLLRSAYAVTRDHQRAEDAVQTAFAQALTRWDHIARVDDPVAYVRRIAFHEALSQRRRAFSRRELVAPVLPDMITLPAGAGPEDRLDLWDAIGCLPPRQRAVIVLRYYEDLSEREIAEALGVRPGTVKSQASAALTTLRTNLNQTPVVRAEESAHE